MSIRTVFFGSKPPEQTVCPFHKATQKIEKKYYEFKEKTRDIAREVSAFFVSSSNDRRNDEKTENAQVISQLQNAPQETYGDYVTLKIKIDSIIEKTQMMTATDTKLEPTALQPIPLVDLSVAQYHQPAAQLSQMTRPIDPPSVLLPIAVDFVAPAATDITLGTPNFDPIYTPPLQTHRADDNGDIHSFDDDKPKFAPIIPATFPTKTDNSNVKFNEKHAQPQLNSLPQPMLIPLPQPKHKPHYMPINGMTGLINGYSYMEILTIPWLRKLYGHLIGIFEMESDITVSQIAVRNKVKTNGINDPKIKFVNGATSTIRGNNLNARFIKRVAKLISKIKEKVRDRHLPAKLPGIKKPEISDKLKKKLVGEINKLEQLAKKLVDNIKKLDHAKRGEITNKLLKRFAKEFEQTLKRIEKLLEKKIKELNKKQHENEKRKINDRHIRELKSLVKLLRLLKRKQLIVALLLDSKKNKKNKILKTK